MAKANIGEARARLTKELGREPYMAEVARDVGRTRERVRQVYKANGWVTSRQRDATRARLEGEAADRIARTNRRSAARDQLVSKILSLLDEGLTQVQVGDRLGLRQEAVSRYARTAGRGAPSTRFRPSDESAITDMGRTSTDVANAIGCSVQSVCMERSRRGLVMRRGPRANIDSAKIMRDIADGLSPTGAAAQNECSLSSVYRVIRAHRALQKLGED